MKVTFPHMGYLNVTAKTLLEGFGLDVVVPPPCTKKTLGLGTKLAPEFSCLPLKINIGNYIEAIQMGADTIIMGGGIGPCRFGYYAQIQKEILKDLGFNVEIIVLEPPDAYFSEVFSKLKHLIKTSLKEACHSIYLAWYKTNAIDILQKKLLYIRPREIKFGEADRLFEKAIKNIDNAQHIQQIKKIVYDTGEALESISQDHNKEIIRIALVGEIYTVLEPFANYEMEKKLAQLGVEVKRSIFLSNWINEHLLGGIMPFNLTKKRHAQLARPFLNSFVGGHGRETISTAVELSNEIDGLIQVAPLTCMPEIVAQSILPEVSRKLSLPVMTFYIDEQTGEAGIITRLEAFVDMLSRRKRLHEELI